MTIQSGLGTRVRGLFIDGKGPWGPSDSSTGTDTPSPLGEDSPGPWGGPQRKRRTPLPGAASGASVEDFLRRSRARFGGNLPNGSERSLIGWAVLALVCAWLLFTSVHSIGADQRGVVTRFGRYSGTLAPGIDLTLPFPIDQVKTVDVADMHVEDLGGTSPADLMLTGDQNLINVSYSVRWTVRSPELYLFQLAEPEEAVKQAAQTAMRSVIGRTQLNDAMVDRDGTIQGQVAEETQRILDGYHSGIAVQGVSLKQANTPAALNDVTKDIATAQQDARSYVQQANTYAAQVRGKAQVEAAAFDRAYGQYKLAPDVTRRRMYYETMEQVLSKVDKTIVDAPGVTPTIALPPVQRSQPKASGR